MPKRYVKPKPIPPPCTFSYGAVTASDKVVADRQTDWTPHFTLGLGIFVVMLVAGIFLGRLVFLVWVKPSTDAGSLVMGVVLAVVAIVVVPIVAMFIVRQRDYDLQLREVVCARLNSEVKAREDAERNSASALTMKAETIYGTQELNLEKLSDLFRQAEGAVKQAKQFFTERAYDPFWDSIEHAVELLRQFDWRVTSINHSAKEYRTQLEGHEHTFPSFPIRSEDLPDPDALMKRLENRIAEAQRDFEFTSVFNQRRTTSAIVTGFRNTQDAMASLQNHIVNSLSDLQDSLESGLGNISSNIQEGFEGLAQQQEQAAGELRESLESRPAKTSKKDAKHHEFVEGALDNIQNRRKPDLSETKEPFRKR